MCCCLRRGELVNLGNEAVILEDPLGLTKPRRPTLQLLSHILRPNLISPLAAANHPPSGLSSGLS